MDKPVTVKPLKKSNKSWIAYLAIALILSLWSALGALFFLVVVVIVTQNPPADLMSAVGTTEKRTARRVYTWLFLSSVITVPFFLILVASSYSRNTANDQHVLHAIIPLLLHLPLLLGLTSQSRFVYRHTQQGILLIALRASIAAVALTIGDYPEDGIWLFLLGNGLLWFFGSIWGWVQVNRGECWWMKQKGESILQSGFQLETLTPQKHIERSREFINRYDSKHAKDHALAAFQRGDADVKRQAVKILDVLDEVELF